MTSYLTVAFAALVIAASHRVGLIWIFRNWFRQGLNGDAAFHFAVIREVQKGGVYRGIPEFLIREEPDTYPILFHRIAAWIPASAIERRPYMPNAILFVLLTTGVSLFSQWAASAAAMPTFPATGLVFLLLFLTLPSNASLDMNGLNYLSLSERLLSRFTSGLYFASLAVALAFGYPAAYLIAIAAGSGCLISSMFGRQAIAFTSGAMAILLLDWRPLAVIALAALGALAVDRTYFLRGLRHMAAFSHAYNHHTKLSRYYTRGHNKFVDWKMMLAPGTGLRGALTELETREPTRLLFRYPEIILFLALRPWSGDALHQSAFATVAATLCVYLLTTTKWLRHFGEANRYIEYNTFIIVPLVLAVDLVGGRISLPLIGVYFLWVASLVARRVQWWSTLKYPMSDELRAFISPLRLTEADTVFTVPFTLSAAICVRAPCRGLMYQGAAVTLDLYRKFMEEIPFLKRDWQPLAREFGVTYLIVEKAFLPFTQSAMGWSYDFTAASMVAETENFAAYRTPP